MWGIEITFDQFINDAQDMLRTKTSAIILSITPHPLYVTSLGSTALYGTEQMLLV